MLYNRIIELLDFDEDYFSRQIKSYHNKYREYLLKDDWENKTFYWWQTIDCIKTFRIVRKLRKEFLQELEKVKQTLIK